MDHSVVVVLVLLSTVALRIVLVLGVVWLLIPSRLACPLCSQSTVPLVTNRLARSLRLERRWCLVCGWSGISKRATALGAHARPVTAGTRMAWEGEEWEWRPVEEEGGSWGPDGAGGWL